MAGCGLRSIVMEDCCHRLEIGAQAVRIEPFVDLPAADEVADDAQRIAARAQLLDRLDAAGHHAPLALGATVEVRQLGGVALDVGCGRIPGVSQRVHSMASGASHMNLSAHSR